MEGAGTVDLTTSGVATFPVSWAKRADAGQGTTNPEELIAAAHSACFAMALSNALAENKTPAEKLDITAEVGFKPGVGITGSKLTLTGVVPGLSDDQFAAIAEEAKKGCPVSQALAGIPITLEVNPA
jgi:osmotically inducible protein OsmC